jgi:hypothetical protein
MPSVLGSSYDAVDHVHGGEHSGLKWAGDERITGPKHLRASAGTRAEAQRAAFRGPAPRG